jgi:hypothetical protein
LGTGVAKEGKVKGVARLGMDETKERNVMCAAKLGMDVAKKGRSRVWPIKEWMWI